MNRIKDEKMIIKDVAIVFDDVTEFAVMRYAIDAMVQDGISVDIIVPFDSGYGDLPEHTLSYIKNQGYDVLNDADPETEYRILMTPYPGIKVIKRLSYSYHFLYQYYLLTSKPNPVFKLNWKLEYDAAILFNNYEKNIYSAYGIDCYVVPYWRYSVMEKEKASNGKKNLLILPTFDDISCLECLDLDTVEKLKDSYNIIIKAHHATEFRESEKDRLEFIKTVADEYYTSDTPINELLPKADVVLSDNSGAIFEVVYAGVPIAILSNDFNSRKLGDLDTFQYQMIQNGLIPYSDKPEEVEDILSEAFNYAEKQTQLCEKLFVKSDDPFEEVIKIIRCYIEKDPEKDEHRSAHHILVDQYKNMNYEINKLRKENKRMKKRLNSRTVKYALKIRKGLRVFK